MPTQIQWRRGNTAQTAAFTGALAEITVDTDKKTIVVHDGVTPGGYALAKETGQQDAFAFDTANAAFAKANNEAGVNATQNTNITVAQNTAQAAFNAANAAGSSALVQYAANHANGAFAAANTADVKGTSAGVYANGAFAAANTADVKGTAAGIYANGAFSVANGAVEVNLTQNTSIAAAFITANSSGVYANGAFAKANNEAGVNLTQNTNIQFAWNHANAAFNTANNVAPQIEPAFTVANGAFAKANNEAGVNNTQNTNITNAQNTAAAAFIRANNSLNANNGGTITGDLSISGNLSVLGNTFTISATTLVANDTVILLGAGNYTSDLLDIGISAHYNDGVNAHTGFIRDHGSKEWQLFEGYTGEIGANNDIDINNASFKIATLNANLKSQTITLNGQNLQTYINGSYNKANAAFNSANNIDGINTTQNNSITAAFAAANTADVKGTSAGIYANGAFAAANTADNKGTSAGVYANGAFNAANSNYTSAVTKLDVTNSGSSAFLIDQYSGNNPTIYVRAGETIAFNLNVTGHPFMIRVSSGGSNYDTGLTHVDLNGIVNTGSNAQGKVTGVLYWKVPFDLVGLTYVYQCSAHGGMVGNIVIEQPTVLAFNHANAAFNTANTDVTNINITSNTYGNATHIPIITVSSNGRINTISTIASSGGSGGGGGGLEQVFLLMGA